MTAFYKVSFTGRLSGALGNTYRMEDLIPVSLLEDDTQEDIRLALYCGKTYSGRAYECVSDMEYTLAYKREED